MLKKRKFKPVIKRIKLNPEQAVLACNCWWGGATIEEVAGVANRAYFHDHGRGACNLNWGRASGWVQHFHHLVTHCHSHIHGSTASS